MSYVVSLILRFVTDVSFQPGKFRNKDLRRHYDVTLANWKI